MARSISKLKAHNIDANDKAILACLYYKQPIHARLPLHDKEIISKRLHLMESGGYIKRDENRLYLTKAGISAMKELNGGKMPPMIDFKKNISLNNKEEFIVGRSLAKYIASEFSPSRQSK